MDDEILVCGAVSYFPDDLRGVCPCGNVIVFRPHTALISRKICVTCMELRMAANPREAFKFLITKRVGNEILQYLNSRKN